MIDINKITGHIDLLINDVHEIEKWRADNSYEPQFKLSEMERLREELNGQRGYEPFDPAKEVERLRKEGKIPPAGGTSSNNQYYKR